MDVDNEQAKLWNGTSGHAWIELQTVLDQILKPFEDLLVGAVSAASGTRVLDVGCGTGSTTLAAARVLGAGGSGTDIDISQPMITATRARVEREKVRASFICADAQTHIFEPASFDTIISRFGVMFSVIRYRPLPTCAAPQGRRRSFALSRRSAEENPFMTTAERAAAPLLPALPTRLPGIPGQFAFADRHRIGYILEQSDWADIDIRPIDVACTLPEKELVPYLSRLGPVGQILQEADKRTRARVIEKVRTAFDPYVYGAEVSFTAACWMVGAQAAAVGNS